MRLVMNSIDGAVLASGTRSQRLDDGSMLAYYDRFGTGARIGNDRLPDFKKSYMYTTKEPSMSDEELKEAISKIAREDAKRGLFQNQTKTFLDLRKEYISSVSPDRESIITNSMKEINTVKKNICKADLSEHAKTLLQLLADMGKKGNNKIIRINGSTVEACFEGDNLTYAEFHDSKGEKIADYSCNNGWNCFFTKAEVARDKEFTSTYNEAWNSANAEIKAQKNPSVPKHIEDGTTFDAYA
jgi:hypothetical protein